MNFATLQGLTIPEGVVTQITDASGRVIWSAVRVSNGVFYFRPSADVAESVGGLEWGSTIKDGYYLNVNEEVSDEESTTISAIFAASNTSGIRDIEFQTACAKIDGFKKVTSAKVYISYMTDGDDQINSLTITATLKLNGNNAESIPIVSNAKTGGNYTLTFASLNNAISTINNHLANSENGIFPSVNLGIAVEVSTGSVDTKIYPMVYISQIYIEFECKYVE